MAQDVKINIKADSTQAVKSVGTLNKEIDKTTEKLVSPTTELRKLEDRMAAIGNVGSKEFQKLAKEAGKLKDQINNAKAASRALSSDFPRLQLGAEAFKAIGGAAQAAMGVTALLGDENKELQKSIQKMIAVQSIMNGLNTIAAALSDETLLGIKARIALQKAQVVVTKSLAAAQKVMNAIMSANPIGLIVLAVAALIAGIVLLIKNIDSVIAIFGDWRTAVLALLGPIGWAILAYEKLQKTRNENFKENIANAAKEATSIRNQIALIEKQREAEKRVHDRRIVEYGLEIAELEALGKDSTEVRRKMLEDIIAEAEAVVAANLVKRESYQNYFKGLKDASTESLRQQVEDMRKVGDAVNDAAADALEARLDLEQSQIDDVKTAKTDLLKFDTDNEKKRADAAFAETQRLIKLSTDAWLKFDKLMIDMKEDSMEKEIDLAQFALEQETKDLSDKIPAQHALRLKLYEKFLLKKQEIEKKYEWESVKNLEKMEMVKTGVSINEGEKRNESSVAQSETFFQKTSDRFSSWFQYNREKIDAIKGHMSSVIQDIGKVMSVVQEGLAMKAENDAIRRQDEFNRTDEALKASLANREISQIQYDNKLKALNKKKEIEDRQAKRKAFAQQKAIQIVNAVMTTAQAVIAAFSSGAAIPIAGVAIGPAMAAVAAGLGAAQIGIIASQKFKAARGGVVPGAPSKTDSVDAMLAPGEAVINSTSSSMFPQLLSSINQAGGGISLAPDVASTSSTSTTYQENKQETTVKAYVVESEVSETQKRVGRIERAATLG